MRIGNSVDLDDLAARVRDRSVALGRACASLTTSTAAWRAALLRLPGALLHEGGRAVTLLLPAGRAAFRRPPGPDGFCFTMDVTLSLQHGARWVDAARRSVDPSRPDRLPHGNALAATRRCRAVLRDGALSEVRFEEPIVALARSAPGCADDGAFFVSAAFSMRGEPPGGWDAPRTPLMCACGRGSTAEGKETTFRWTRSGDGLAVLHVAGLLLCDQEAGLRDYVASQRGRCEADAAARIARLWRRVSADPATPAGRRAVEARFWALAAPR